MSRSHLEILQTGPLALIQDRGRIGHLAIGVGRSGAADLGAHALANRLLGNPAGAASIECTLGGLRVRADGRSTVCVTGAPAAVSVDSRPVGHGALVELPDGATLTVGMPPNGARTYLGVRGGIAVPRVLGSRATDTLSGIGPAPLRPGDRLRVGRTPRRLPHVEAAPTARPWPAQVTLRVLPGPRAHWFEDPDALARTTWTVSSASDRRGVRLHGIPLQRNETHAALELPSEGMVRGAIQVPPSGEPVILLNDHPVSGGYPVIGVLLSADVDRVAQLTPTGRVRFRWVASVA